MAQCQAVIFDLDGTLLDSLADLAQAANFALTAAGHPTHATNDYRMMIGDGADMLIRRALPDDHQDQAEAVLAAFRARYADHLDDTTRPFAGVGSMLNDLATRGLPMAILSNKPHAATLPIVDRLLGNWSWAQVRGHQPPAPKKPDPAAALAIAAELECDPSACWFVGDGDADMQAAARAGMHPVAVLWGYRSKAALAEAGAIDFLEQPADLIDRLGG